MPVFNNVLGGSAGAGGGDPYEIKRSIRLNDADTAFLGRTSSSASSGNKKLTYSIWVKGADFSDKTPLYSASSSGGSESIEHRNDGTLVVFFNEWTNGAYYTTDKFRDPSAWYHFVFVIDTTLSTAADRVKIYVNGERVSTSISGTLSQDYTFSGLNQQNKVQYIGRTANTSGGQHHYASAYFADIHMIDGQALNPVGVFGTSNSTTGSWDPIEFTGTYGTNGFHLDFSDNSSASALGNDAAGNNNFTNTNLVVEASTHAVAGTHQNKVGISFNGTNASIELSSDSDLNPGSGVFTLEAYAYALSGGNAEFGIYDGTTSGASGQLVIRRVGAGTIMLERANQAFDITGGSMSEDSWHHVAVTRDSSNNVRLFLDGTLQGTSTNNTQNYQGHFRIGRTNNAFTNGYVSNLRLIKGSCLYTANFTPPSLPLSNVSGTTLLMAQSTSSATAATVKPSGVTISGSGDDGVGIDSLLDSPTNYDDGTDVGGNFCTWNPLSTTGPTFAQGNLYLTHTGSGSGGWRNISSTMAVSSGKWYAEFKTVGSQNGGLFIGIQKIPEDHNQFHPKVYDNNFPGRTPNSYSLNCFSGQKRTNNSDSGYGSGMSVNDTIMMALDLDNGKVWWGKNGTWFGSGDPDSGTNAAFTGLTGTFVFAVGIAASEQIHSNFGQRPYKYSNNISGFKSVCTANLADPAIENGATEFDVIVTDSGTASDRVFTMPGGFGPNLVWAKQRNSSTNHAIFDSVRGATKRLTTNNTPASEDTQVNQLKSFSDTGFTYGADIPNNSGQSGVYWCWDGGSSFTNNSGSNGATIASTGVANNSAGMSIVGFTGNGTAGATVRHGLNIAPELVLYKNRDRNENWGVYSKVVGASKSLYLNKQSQALTANSSPANMYNSTDPSSTVLTLGDAVHVNANNEDIIAYCFAPVESYSSFGLYTGNDSGSDGAFIHCGFRPKFIFVKIRDQQDHWTTFDSARGNNENDLPLYLNLTNSEGSNSSRKVDLVSNGFKFRAGDNSINGNFVYFYAAFAEHPFKTARAA